MLRLLFIYIVSSLFFLGCNNRTSTSTSAWIGGEIINPVSSYIELFKDGNLIDSIRLDAQNRFLYQVDNVDKGIYIFRHKEHQMFYLEPNDSIMLRVNTLEFDKSLTFSGRGAERNNFLIQIFNHNEEENKQSRHLYSLEVDAFLSKVDSMSLAKYKILDRFIDRYKPCDDFYEVAESSILYNKYLKLEFYAFINSPYKANENSAELPENYFDFRKKIDYNNKNLQSYYTYFRFLSWHFDYLAYDRYKNEHPFDRKSIAHYQNKIQLIDEYVNLNSLKDNLFRNTTRRYIMHSNNVEDISSALSTFLAHSNNEAHINEITTMANSAKNLTDGKQMPDVLLIDAHNATHSFKDIIKHPTVVLFWSTHASNQARSLLLKVEELKIKYPEYHYIAINTDKDKELWENYSVRLGFLPSHSLRFENPSEAIDILMLNSLNKAIVLDQNALILGTSENLFSYRFEQNLLSYLNR